MGRAEHLKTYMYGLHRDVSRPNTDGAWYMRMTFKDALQTRDALESEEPGLRTDYKGNQKWETGTWLITQYHYL